MHKSGDLILVRNSDNDEWEKRWFIANHPFSNKIVTSSNTQELESWFQSCKFKSNTNDSKTSVPRRSWEGQIDARYHYIG